MGALTRVVVVEVIWSFTNSGCVPKILLINLDFDMLWKDVRDKEESGIIVQIDELRKSSRCFFSSSSSSFLVWIHYLAFFCFCCCSLFFFCLFVLVGGWRVSFYWIRDREFNWWTAKFCCVYLRGTWHDQE